MPKLSDETHTLIPGVAVLYRRSRSAAWQVRYKANGKWLRSSTKQRDLKLARNAGNDIVLEGKYREKVGLPTQSKRFSAVAKIAITRMQAALDHGEGRIVYTHYVGALDNYLIPYLGNHNVSSIDNALLKSFATWRAETMKHAPKASTINTHNAALNRVFDVALELGYMNTAQLPLLINKARDSDRRPDFTLDEYKRLFRFMRGWIARARTSKSKQMRELLRDYVLILANTGMRHGTESNGLKWKHVSEFDDNDRRYLALWVNGKTGGRELVARHSCVTYLKRIHARSEDLKHLTWEQLLAEGRDEYVFRLADGTKTSSLGQTFEAMLDEAKLLKDRRTEQNRTLYSLRHTYATFNLVKADVDIYTLATQMGTSVLMIEKHYSHLMPRQRARDLAGRLNVRPSEKAAKAAVVATTTKVD